MTTDTDVIIIGAGVSGLSAAKALIQNDISCTVIEGSHRIGGRAYSEEIAPDVWFDLGCSYMHEGVFNPFVPIARSLGIEIGEEHGEMFEPEFLRFYKNGHQLTSAEEVELYAFYKECHDRVSASCAQGEDIAIADLVDFDSPFIRLYMNGMAALNAMDIDENSALDYNNAGGFSVDELDLNIPILKGYGNLIKKWAGDVPVSLNTKVEAIDWSGSCVEVETAKGTIRGRSVLTTVSTGILSSGQIQFKPGLPSWKIDAINGLPTGTENKICVHFDKDIFGDEGRGFHNSWHDDGHGNGKEGSGFEASVMGLPTAVVFTGGRHAIWLEKQGQAASHDFAVDQVADVFGNDIRKHATRSIVTAWASEPWTLGSYSCAKPGQYHQRAELAKSIDDRVFFAGEATHGTSQSTCHGAYLSGLRVADEIISALKT